MVKQARSVLNSFCSNAANQVALYVARLTLNHSMDLGSLGNLGKLVVAAYASSRTTNKCQLRIQILLSDAKMLLNKVKNFLALKSANFSSSATTFLILARIRCIEGVVSQNLSKFKQ